VNYIVNSCIKFHLSSHLMGLRHQVNALDLLRPTWLMSYMRLQIYPADVTFAQHRHWPSQFLRHASGQLVIMLFRQLHHGHGTLSHWKSHRWQHCQHLNLNWRHISFLFLFLIFSFLCTVTAVLCTIHFKFLIMIMIILCNHFHELQQTPRACWNTFLRYHCLKPIIQ